MYDNVFINSASGFIVYYLSGADGFTSPIWMGYPSEIIDEVTYPASRWLLVNGMTFDTDLHQDLNGDGVDLLLAYALDLVPENAVSGLPGPILDASSLSMDFYASALGVNYTVQTSEDMKSWSTEGVALSPIDSNGRRTATVDRSLTKRFMRLVVSD